MSDSLRDELFAIKIWLEYWLGTKCESRHSRDANGHINNTWGVVPIPDWDVKQKIQRIDEALAGFGEQEEHEPHAEKDWNTALDLATRGEKVNHGR